MFKTNSLLISINILFIYLDDSICFQYYNLINGEIKAQSSHIPLIHDNNNTSTIDNTIRPVSIKIYGKIFKKKRTFKILIFVLDLHATNLQRGVFFKPDPYIKVSLIAGRLHKQLRTSSHFYNQEKRTNVIPNTVNKNKKKDVLFFF
jgi:hypothetical protein